LITLPFILSGIALPQITAAFSRGDASEANQIIQRSFDALAIFALPLMIGAQFVAAPLMALVAGQEFALSGRILRLLIIACGAIYLGAIFSHAVVAVAKQKKLIPAYGFVAVTSLIGYLIFIPRYSYFGAAGVTIYSEAAMSLLTFVIAFYCLKFAPNLKIFLKAFLASLIMGLILYLSPSLNFISALSLAAIVYAVSLGLLMNKELKKLAGL